MTSLSTHEIRAIKKHYAEKWLDPVSRIEDTFNVRRADGSCIPLRVPEPQKKIIRDGILGKSQDLVGSGTSYVSVTNKGRQLGFSVIIAAEQILIAEDFPNTYIYYVATATDQAEDWMNKVNQLLEDVNHWPAELGGGKMVNITNIKKVFEKVINGTHIVGLSANPPAIRGKTGISVVFDEAAWAIREKGIAKETWKALKYIIRQGGSARIQSTPRLSDEEEFFWGMLKKGESGMVAIHRYECPVITNWKELDLEEPLYIDLNNTRREKMGMDPLTEEQTQKLISRYKNMPKFLILPGDCIKQEANIPYWWVGLQDLETDRQSDLEQFKQENLGVPLDETYKLIKTEWIYQNLNDTDEIDVRQRNNQNNFYISCDFAQKKDLTALTVVEEIPVIDKMPIYIERKIVETQAEYPTQVDMIFDMYMAFRPKKIMVDYTGHGIPIYDMLAKRFRVNSFDPDRIIQKNTFTMQLKEQMALGFKNIVMPDPITGKSRYRWLHKERHHQAAIRHCIRVEREILPQGGIRYSGKMHGRDDHFWSKAQLALIETGLGVPKACLGKIKKETFVGSGEHRTLGQKFIEEINKRRMEVDIESRDSREEVLKDRQNRFIKRKNLNFAREALRHGVIVCRTTKKPVNPIHCADISQCNDPRCSGYKYVSEICYRYGVNKDEL
jgi:hypothetical protein